MTTLSTGEKATLGGHRKMAVAFLGEDSKAVQFLDKKIKDAPNGEDEEVIIEEGQFVHLLLGIHIGKYEG